MRKLFNFLARYSIAALFLFLEIISFAMLVSNERYPKSVFFSSSNGFFSRVYYVSNYVSEFFRLRPANESLSKENADLKSRVAVLENKLALVDFAAVDTSFFLHPEKEYEFIHAKIINNSTNRIRNFITLNKGEIDGVRPDMGVISSEGVAGIVKTVSPRFSTVISVLNPMIQINSKIVGNDYTGPLAWNGEDYRYANLMDIPRHVILNKGDSVVTSGLTAVFPEGIPIGVIEDFSLNDGDAYYDIKVRLAVDFRMISHVNIADYKNRDEQLKLEEEN